jgi:hypothetical protein
MTIEGFKQKSIMIRFAFFKVHFVYSGLE